MYSSVAVVFVSCLSIVLAQSFSSNPTGSDGGPSTSSSNVTSTPTMSDPSSTSESTAVGDTDSQVADGSSSTTQESANNTNPTTPETIQKTTEEANSEMTQKVTPEMVQEETSEMTPETTPDMTPEKTPETTPEVTQEVTSETTQDTTPEVTPVTTEPSLEFPTEPPSTDTSISEMRCNRKKIQCIKDANGGKPPFSLWTAFGVLFQRRYSMVRLSKWAVETYNVSCITTYFGLFGFTSDSFYDQCELTDTVSYRIVYAGLQLLTGVLYIDDYMGQDLTVYPVYSNNNILSFYVCSPEGTVRSKSEIYITTSRLQQGGCRGEVLEAQRRLEACGLDDTQRICKKNCDRGRG